MPATGIEAVKLSQLQTALEGIGSGGRGMRLVKATMSKGVITPPDGVDVSSAEYVFIAPGMYDDGNTTNTYPFTTLLEIQEVDSVDNAKQQPFPIRTSSSYVNVSCVSLVLVNGVYTLYNWSNGVNVYSVKCTPYFILTQ